MPKAHWKPPSLALAFSRKKRDDAAWHLLAAPLPLAAARLFLLLNKDIGMAIDFKCVCGAMLSFADEQAGFDVECPHCGHCAQLPGAIADAQGQPRKRSAVAGAAVGIVVAAIVLVGLVLGLAGKEERITTLPEMRLIPSDAIVVAGANVWRIVRLEALQEGLDALKEQEEYRRIQEAGFNWEAVETVHLAVAAQAVGADEPEILVLLRSREAIPLEAMAQAAAEAAEAEAVETTVGGRKAYSLRMPHEGPVAVLLEDRLMAAGTAGMVAKSVALADGQGESVESNARLMELARGGVRPELAWLVADLPKEQMRELAATAPMLPFKPEVLQGLLAHLDYAKEKGLTLGVSLMCETEDAAKQTLPPLEATVRAFAPMMVQVDQEAIVFDSKGNRVNMRVTVPDEVLAQIAEQAQQRVAREAQRGQQVPEWVLETEQTLILSEMPFEERTFKYGDIMNTPIDRETGYRRIEGKLWASPMECASSVIDGNPHRIPAPPRPMIAPGEEGYGVEEEGAKPYPCPVCGKEANPELVPMTY